MTVSGTNRSGSGKYTHRQPPPHYMAAGGADGERMIVMAHDADASSSSLTSESDRVSDKTPPPRMMNRARLYRMKADNALHSMKCQVFILALIASTICVSVIDLLVRVQIVPVVSDTRRQLVTDSLYFMTLALLGFMMCEMIAKIVVWQLRFFKHRCELFDASIILLTIGLAIYVGHDADYNCKGVGFLIGLRLWRVHKLFEGMVKVVKVDAERRTAKERRARRALEREVAKLREYCLQQECELQMYRMMLQDNNIPQPTVLRAPSTAPRQLNVIVEVNEPNSANGSAHGHEALTTEEVAELTSEPPPDYAETMAEYVPLQTMTSVSQQHSPASSG